MHCRLLAAPGLLSVLTLPATATTGLLLSGCASSSTFAAAEAPASTTATPTAGDLQSKITPFADYHAHIFSHDVAAHRVRPPLPAVDLPEDLAQVLRQRALLAGGKEGFRNRLALVDLYTNDALVLDARFRTWVRGPAAASIHASLQGSLVLSGEPFRLTPVSFRTGDSVGNIAGYFTQGQGSAEKHVGFFDLALKKGQSGSWLIATETATFPGPSLPEAAPVEKLIAEMDAAGVRKALIPSTAYWWGSSGLAPAEDEYAKVQAENNWVAEQVARYPDRLVGFCSFNPLKDYALEEIARCADQPHLKGVKLHIADANVDLMNPQHVERLRRVFRAANEHQLPIAAHVATQDLDYGREHAEVYLNQIFPAAPDIPIQIMHLAGHGPSHGGEALRVFAEAAEAGDPRMKNVYFEVASNVQSFTSPQERDLIAQRLRQIGMDRVLFGTDRPAAGPRFTAKEAWAAFRRLPLTEEEFRAVADNVTPYMR